MESGVEVLHIVAQAFIDKDLNLLVPPNLRESGGRLVLFICVWVQLRGSSLAFLAWAVGSFLYPAFSWFRWLKVEESVLTHLAVGASLACVIFSRPSAPFWLIIANKVIWKSVKDMSGFLILGAVLGAWTADQLSGYSSIDFGFIFIDGH